MRIDECNRAYHRQMASATNTRGEMLQQLRKRKGVSQTELAHAIGIRTQGTISAWENDKQEIDPDNLLRLAEYFRVDPASLGYVVPSVVSTDDVRQWFEEMFQAAEERHRVRHEETMQALRELVVEIRSR